ncbi:conjugal transfer protein TraI [Mucilaginibacter sp. PPCGB 2223]|uniref:tellurite resistance TerB family protein n=1 Tax=Mucilaginibacter sp. PPCGB 2223 TaxID=1886027 RepID=UPI0008257158|nr:TerB family tellurite resistance protein [Mucilaginibacter sp. PPCGB 2223]OCX54335.1 conjugal transfer protein TraI [Mucilaginibacter sp. PPCGB 2223]
MKSFKITFVLLLLGAAAHAQFAVGSVLNATVGKIIRAIDLQVQKAQNQTIWLQNAQKEIENELHQLQLSNIAGISTQQKNLFTEYYKELLTVKSAINDYGQIVNIISRQEQLVSLYKTSWSMTRQDGHFSVAELQQIDQVYSGILLESANNLDQLAKVMNSFQTQMTDEQRIEIIDRLAKQVDGNYNDLKKFTNQNIQLSMARAKDQQDVQSIKNLYGIH